MVRNKPWTLFVVIAGIFCISLMSAPTAQGEEMEDSEPQEGVLDSGLIFDHGPDLPSSHASTIYAMPDGTVMAAWYSGSAEANRDVAVYGSRYKDGEWSKPEVIADTPGKPEGNPVLWTDKDDKVWLFFVTIHGFGWNWAKIKYRTSDDAGETWGPVVMLRNKRGWMTRNHPIYLSDGSILLPLYSENKWCSEFMKSRDGGQSWEHISEVCSRPGNIQAAVVELDDGTLYSTMRTGGRKGKGRVWETRSSDGGVTWSGPTRTKLPNPNAGTDMIELPSGRLLIAYNDSLYHRTPLSLAVSDDGGKSWRKVRDVEHDEGEYSYPSLCLDEEGNIHLTYTYRRISIKHVKFSEEWVK